MIFHTIVLINCYGFSIIKVALKCKLFGKLYYKYYLHDIAMKFDLDIAARPDADAVSVATMSSISSAGSRTLRPFQDRTLDDLIF